MQFTWSTSVRRIGSLPVRPALALAILLPALMGAAPVPAHLTLVLCSPGSPGTTAEAQPTLDAFAAAAGKAAGWPDSTLTAVYFENAPAGRQRLTESDAALALVSAPFYFEFATALSLQPRLEAIPEAGPGEQYTLVAKQGLASSPASLAGWEITGTPGFSPDFVRDVVLGDWGKLPSDVRITPSSRPLSDLRRGASGEKVAILLDRAGTKALAGLPFASELKVLHTSKSIPAGLLCAIPKRLPASRGESLERALLGLQDSETGREVLKSIRLAGFARLDAERLRRVTRPAAPLEQAKP
jgi:phosphonate ABC transporter substrate-binding protein